MTKMISLISLLAIGCGVEPGESETTSDLTAAQRRARATAIRDGAAQRGVTNGALLAGVSQVETGLAHCWSEATWACQGPASSSCGGGPVIAGAGDGACSARQGGLGMFQFDGGTYDQTLARDGAGILTVEGSVAHEVDFLATIVQQEVSGVGSRAAAIAWMNGITIRNGDARFEQWKAILACRYNGACGSVSQATKYGNATVDLLGEFGAAFWATADATPEWYAFSGDWDGDGTKTPGLYSVKAHRWLLSNHNSGGGVDHDFGWGGDGYLPVVGDWNGDGIDSPGLYNPTTHIWNLSNHLSGGGVDITFGWGGGNQVPVAGDWNGDGIDTPGLFDPATRTWTLSNHNAGGGFDAKFGWGGAGQVPLVGDWNGDGVDSPGLYNRTTHVWTLSNVNASHGIDAQFGWGGLDRLPVVGDWDGNGTDTPGLLTGDTRTFTLSNVNAGGGAAASFGWGPVGTYTVVGAP